MAGTQLRIEKGQNGWGGPLLIEIEPQKKVVSMTGAGIHPVAARPATAAAKPAPAPQEETETNAMMRLIQKMGSGIGMVTSMMFESGREATGIILKSVIPFMAFVSALIGAEIGLGHIPPQFALPALFAINVQVGADFVPVGLSMQEAEPDTIKYGVPAFLISRQITGPIAVVAAYFMSIGLFQ